MSSDGTSPSKEATTQQKRKQKVSFLKLFSFADSLDYILMVIGSVAACVQGASVPVFFIFLGKMLNIFGIASLYPTSVSHKVAKYALDFVYLSIVILFSSWAEVACWMYTGERQATKMRLAYLRAMLNQDISLFDTESRGDVITAITSDTIVIQDAISEKVGNFLHYLSRFIAGFAIGFCQVWQISLVTLSILPLIVIAGGLCAYISTGLISKVRKSYVKAGEIAEELISNVRMVQAFSGEEKAVKSYTRALVMTYKYGKRGGLAKGLGLGSMHFVIFCSYALLIWFTSIAVHKQIANGGESFTTMINVIISGISLGLAAPNIFTFIRAREAAYPILSMIDRYTINKGRAKTGRTLPIVEGYIQFKDICFSYPSRPDLFILDKLCLDIPAGKIVALVGGSGSGKSTVISLIEGFYKPLSGRILLDGHDFDELELKWIRRQIGLVNQEPALFATSIRENILYGKDDATLEEITHAAQLADALTFINNLPDRFETQVGERGIQLSGGQKQRIAISRAIIRKPSILLLDEATSALDAESERSVQKALDRVMVGQTTVVVAHRLSTVRHVDMIAVVQDGKIVESGNHDELISNPNGIYAALVKVQEADASSSEASLYSAIERPTSSRYSKEVSQSTSFGRSFRSDKDSISHYDVGNTIQTKLKPVSVRRLYAMAAPDWIYGLLGTIGAMVFGAQMPLFALGVSDSLVAYYMPWESAQREVRKISLLFCGGAIASVIFHTIEHFSFGIMGERLTLRVREMILAAILRNEIGWFDEANNNSSILSLRLDADATLIRKIVVDHSTILLQNLFLTIVSFVIGFILNWRMTLLVIAVYPLLICGHITDKQFMHGYGGDLSKAYLKANMLASEAVSNIRTVAAYCSEDKIINLYANELTEPSKRSFSRGQIAGLTFGVTQFFVFSSYGLALWYGSVLMGRGQSSFKSVVKAFMVLIIGALTVGETLALAPDLIKGYQMVASVFELLDRETEVAGDVGEEVTKVDGNIEMRNINFSYPSRPDIVIFKDFNLQVSAGSSMALVGSSGSGKSSVISLILRFYDPASGRVMVDGKDIKKLQLKSLRKFIGFVQQEPSLFATSIYENIAYGRDNASESEVIEAAKVANAHNFISSLPEGYSTKVGERGIQLSGGQKQRVSIARAVLRNPKILLLDEATSALDVESERLVQQALDRIMKNKTTIMVAHRLSTIQNADQISVLQDGVIVEQGSHTILLEKKGAYYNLVSLQQQKL
ncbi:ABC-type xenobiotic transporter [Ranunculus cassubicifolius]